MQEWPKKRADSAIGVLLGFLRVLWALPWTLVGAIVGLLGIASGGRIALHCGVLECHGGLVARLLERLPNEPMAMTLGHVVLGRTDAALDITRKHERIHVRQYERWGPLFVPAYLLCSFVLWIRGQDPYRQNPFEREAFEREGGRGK
jgi:hypothetical protein